MLNIKPAFRNLLLFIYLSIYLFIYLFILNVLPFCIKSKKPIFSSTIARWKKQEIKTKKTHEGMLFHVHVLSETLLKSKHRLRSDLKW